MARFINPFTDWGFKRIFGQEVSKDILIRFLNVLLEGEQEIRDITFLNTERNGATADNRTIIYDVYCATSTGEHIIVEMQNRNKGNFIDRTLFYMAAAIYGQGSKGNDWNYEIDAVYGVFFMNFRLAELGDKLRTDVTLADMATGKPFSGKMRMTYIQLPEFTKEEDECETFLDCWIYTLKNMEVLNRMPFAARDAVLKRLGELADISTMTRLDDYEYQSSLKFLRDTLAEHEYSINEGRKQGIEQGMAEGRKLGMAQSMAQGMAQGETKGEARVIRDLLSYGMSEQKVAEATHKTVDEVRALLDACPA